MAEIVLFHHVQGLTDGVRWLAEALRQGGHVVHTPDLFDGALPGSIEEGMALVQGLGDDVVNERVGAAMAALPTELVYAGISFGVGPAQELAQTQPGARGALLYEGCLPITGEWAVGPWPDGVPVQVHGMERDPIFALDGDLAAATELVESVAPGLGELYIYPGDQHLFTDPTLESYDARATALVVERSLAMLARLG